MASLAVINSIEELYQTEKVELWSIWWFSLPATFYYLFYFYYESKDSFLINLE